MHGDAPDLAARADAAEPLKLVDAVEVQPVQGTLVAEIALHALAARLDPQHAVRVSRNSKDLALVVARAKPLAAAVAAHVPNQPQLWQRHRTARTHGHCLPPTTGRDLHFGIS